MQSGNRPLPQPACFPIKYMKKGLIGLLFQRGIHRNAQQRSGVGLAQGRQLLGEIGRRLQQRLDIGPVAVEAEVLLGEIVLHLPDGLGVVYDQRIGSLLPVQRLQQPFDVKGRDQLGHLVHRHRVIALVVLRPLQLALDLLGDQGVKGQGIGQGLLLLLLRERRVGQHLGRHVRIERQKLLAAFVVLRVVGGVRQDDIRAEDDEGVPGRVPHVGLHAHPQGQVELHREQLRRRRVQVLHGLDGADLIQKRKHGGDALPIPPLAVQHLFVQRNGVLHLRDVSGLAALGKGAEVRHHLLFHILIQLGKAAGGGSVLRDHSCLEPLPVDRFIEIVLNPDFRIAHAPLLLSCDACFILL